MVEYVDLEESKGPNPREVEYKNFKRLQLHNFIIFSIHLIIILWITFTFENNNYKAIIMSMYAVSSIIIAIALNIRLSLLKRKYKKIEDILEDISSKNRKRYK